VIAFFRLVLVALLLAGPALAAEGIDTPLADPAAEARARDISRTLRCLVCQNQSIEDSNAPLAQDLRQIVRERVQAGDDDEAVRRFLVARYGDWVLLKPPFKGATLLLWIGPVLILLAGAATVALLYRRQRRQAAAPAPLSADEAARLAALTGRDDPPS
jgi:cytochrome c-type biogenesis protein CcmH